MENKKIRIGYVHRVPMQGDRMNVIIANGVWTTTPVIKVEELFSDSNPRVFKAETANTVYVVAYITEIF